MSELLQASWTFAGPCLSIALLGVLFAGIRDLLNL